MRTLKLIGMVVISLLATPPLWAQTVPGGSDGKLTPEQVMTDPDMPFVGSKNADLTIVEFMDYNCPYCRKSAPALEKLLAKDDKVRVLYRDWPIFGPVSEYAARVAVAAKWQGKYAAAHKAMMSTPERFINDDRVRATVAKAGLDMKRLDEDLISHEADIDRLLARNDRQANAIGLQGTPAWIIGPYLIPGALNDAQLQQVVAMARKKQAQK
jgi:protein-disulfide isomerase